MLQVTPNTMEISFKIPGNVLFCNLFLLCSVQLAAFLYFGYFPIFGCVTGFVGFGEMFLSFAFVLSFCMSFLESLCVELFLCWPPYTSVCEHCLLVFVSSA